MLVLTDEPDTVYGTLQEAACEELPGASSCLNAGQKVQRLAGIGQTALLSTLRF